MALASGVNLTLLEVETRVNDEEDERILIQFLNGVRKQHQAANLGFEYMIMVNVDQVIGTKQVRFRREGSVLWPPYVEDRYDDFFEPSESKVSDNMAPGNGCLDLSDEYDSDDSGCTDYGQPDDHSEYDSVEWEEDSKNASSDLPEPEGQDDTVQTEVDTAMEVVDDPRSFAKGLESPMASLEFGSFSISDAGPPRHGCLPSVNCAEELSESRDSSSASLGLQKANRNLCTSVEVQTETFEELPKSFSEGKVDPRDIGLCRMRGAKTRVDDEEDKRVLTRSPNGVRKQHQVVTLGSEHVIAASVDQVIGTERVRFRREELVLQLPLIEDYRDNFFEPSESKVSDNLAPGNGCLDLSDKFNSDNSGCTNNEQPDNHPIRISVEWEKDRKNNPLNLTEPDGWVETVQTKVDTAIEAVNSPHSFAQGLESPVASLGSGTPSISYAGLIRHGCLPSADRAEELGGSGNDAPNFLGLRISGMSRTGGEGSSPSLPGRSLFGTTSFQVNESSHAPRARKRIKKGY